MRVLITTDTVGGVWTFTQELAAGLLQRGCPVLLVSFGAAPTTAQQDQCQLLAHDYPGRFRYKASDIPLEWMEQNEHVFEDGAALLQDEIERFAPDVLHCNQFCYGALDSKLPRIVTAHSDVLSWAKACRGVPLPETQWLHRYLTLVQAGLIDCDAVVAPTLWMLNALRESFTVPDETFAIANGRSVTANFDSARELRAVTAGRLWDEAKGIGMLQELNSSIPIAIAGSTRHESNKVSLGKAILLGQLSEPEMIDLLQQSSLYLCLSCYEPFGLAPLEAGLCGCAVIARDIPSLREVWADGALFFDDAQTLGLILHELKRSPLALLRARERSYRRARQYTRERMVGQYMNLYRSILEHSERAENVA